VKIVNQNFYQVWLGGELLAIFFPGTRVRFHRFGSRCLSSCS